MSTEKTTFTTAADRDIHIERIFNASRDRVWAAATEPDLLKQWWARGNPLEVVKWEFEKGGHWRFVERWDGGEMGFEGRFREITPKDSYSHTFEYDGMPGHVCIETVQFVDLGDGRTKLVVDDLFHTGEERDGMLGTGMETGTNESYAALDALLARGK